MCKGNYSYLFAEELVKNCRAKNLEEISDVEKKAIMFCLDMLLDPKDVVVLRHCEDVKWYCPTCNKFLNLVSDDSPSSVKERYFYRRFHRCNRCGQLINFTKDI